MTWSTLSRISLIQPYPLVVPTTVLSIYYKPGLHMTVVFLHRIETNIAIEFHIEEDNGNYIGKYSQSTMCNYLTRHELELSHLY